MGIMFSCMQKSVSRCFAFVLGNFNWNLEQSVRLSISWKSTENESMHSRCALNSELWLETFVFHLHRVRVRQMQWAAFMVYGLCLWLHDDISFN